MAASSTTAVVAPTSVAEEVAEVSASACEQLSDYLLEPDNLRLLGEEDSAAGLIEILEVLDSTVAVDYEQMLNVQGSTEEAFVQLISLFTAVDDATHAVCGIPVLTAANTLLSSMVFSSVCNFALASEDNAGASEENCVEKTSDPPDELPCFVAIDDQSSGIESYRAADCDTTEPVYWEIKGGFWSTEEPPSIFDNEGFSEIEYEVVDP